MWDGGGRLALPLPLPCSSPHPRRGLLVPDSKAPLLTTNLDFIASIRVWEQALCMWPHSPSQAASIKVTSVCEWLRRVTAAGPAHTCQSQTPFLQKSKLRLSERR